MTRTAGGLELPSTIWLPFIQGRAAVRCSPGHLIYLQNTEATCFYYLKSGRVKSYIQAEDGAQRMLNLYRAGSLFGEAAFFDGQPRVSSAVALTDCELVAIDREQVSAQFSQQPELALAMINYLARTVRLLSRQVDDMAFRPARWRIARYLLEQKNEDGLIHATQEEISSAVSVSRVTVSRMLGEFSRQGLVKMSYGAIRLMDRESLGQLCGEDLAVP